MRIRFDQGPDGKGRGFANPRALIRADEPDQVAAALVALDTARASGKWLAGYASYELGFALEPRLAHRMPEVRRLPLLCFGVYDAPQDMPLRQAGATLEDILPVWDEAEYAQAFNQVHDYIGAGDFYQANLTFPMTARSTATSDALYAALVARQEVGHGALVQQEGLPDLLSRSPELFFRTHADGQIETCPMKGTQPRSEDAAQDAQARMFLITDEKNRAENLMIVDLLRNDISRVSEPGSVHVPELFKVETYATVHQMVSRVAAQLRPDAGLSDIFHALYPCGSITGAPKIRAMEVLHDLEAAPREIYCGTIGWAAPDGRSEFNVAIRTLMKEGDQITFNVGGGVVWDSTAEAEYEEALWKARFARQLNQISA